MSFTGGKAHVSAPLCNIFLTVYRLPAMHNGMEIVSRSLLIQIN